jgi:hypothetical protein
MYIGWSIKGSWYILITSTDFICNPSCALRPINLFFIFYVLFYYLLFILLFIIFIFILFYFISFLFYFTLFITSATVSQKEK